MLESEKTKRLVVKEITLLIVLLFVGLVILPLSVYFVGQAIFGEYGDGGLAGFFGNLHREFRSGNPVVSFLLFSPYILWQLIRLTFRGFQHLGRRDASET